MQRDSQFRTVLLLGNDAQEIAVLREILEKHVVLVSVQNLNEAAMHLAADAYDALLCDWCFQGGTWREANMLVRNYDPLLPVIVLSPGGGEYEWLEALDGGAFDLLAAPWSKLAVIGTLEHAFASRDARLLRATLQRLQKGEPKMASTL